MKTEKELRELDAFIAEHVIGLHKDERVSLDDRGCAILEKETGNFIRRIVGYTTDPAAAMTVLEKCARRLQEEDKEETVSIGCDDPYYVVEKTNCVPSLRVEANTLPLAIALFAQKLFST